MISVKLCREPNTRTVNGVAKRASMTTAHRIIRILLLLLSRCFRDSFFFFFLDPIRHARTKVMRTAVGRWRYDINNYLGIDGSEPARVQTVLFTMFVYYNSFTFTRPRSGVLFYPNTPPSPLCSTVGRSFFTLWEIPMRTFSYSRHSTSSRTEKSRRNVSECNTHIYYVHQI